MELAKIDFSKKERKQLEKIEKRQYVRRDLLIKIIMAWLITVPASALIAATLFFVFIGIWG